MALCTGRPDAMIQRLTRRGALGLLGAGMATGLVTPACAASPLAPPQTPMLFRRSMMRDAGRGITITVTRGFEIRFVPLASGYRLEGSQVYAEVDAPEELAQIAELERNRIETTVFPVLLDARGLVLDSSGPEPRPTPELDQAVELALARFREIGADETTIADAQTFFQWLQQAGGTIGAEMPPELFVPPPEPQQVIRTIELPGGLTGTIETRFGGTVTPETGLMRTAERAIVTRVEGTSQQSLESWSLTPR